ncbi:retrovirus-related pol polyprotein from transposon TNT 1-94 [Tanacetum coccineum]|uniref:Retrovirus-related pol polyprotein from transposon TNT 1-94 n=1 Tax=Tanacetum coccineum TaxID=301880 RepID=A0ABQ5A2Q5_9ASTR
MNEDKIKKDLEEIETINIELDHRVSKLIAENEHLKQTYKQLYDSIKPTRIRSKEQCDDLINQVNLKSVEISDLNASLQEIFLEITVLKDDLRKLKGKALVDNVVTKHTIDPEMLKIDVEPITPKLLNKKTAHSAYIKHTQKEATVLRDLVEHVKSKYPLDHSLESACRTRVKPSTSASGSQPSGNTKKDKIQQTPSSTQKNKVKAPRKVKSSLKNKDCVVQPKGTAHMQHFKLNANSELKCVKITTTTEVPLRKPTALDNGTPKPVVTLVYLQKPRKFKTNVPVSKSKVLNMLKQLTKREDWKWWFDPMTGSRGNNLYTLSLGDMMSSSSICLLSKALKTNKKKPHKPKSEDTNQEKLYLLHMDLCGPMRVASVNGKKYILVIVDDYSRFTWVKCLRSKDEAPDFIIKFLKMIQVRLKVPVRRIRTDNGTEFVNQTLREYYEKVGISHETFVARSPQQNGVVERRNRTLIEAARTMLIYAKALLFLWAEAVATACYTQNHSIVRLRHDKTPYELLHDKPPDLSFFHVFGALCYPTNDSENLGKLQPKADIDFDELTAMASEHSSSGPALHEMTPATISSGLVPNPPPSTPFVPPSRSDWDLLFQPLFDELLTPPPSVDYPAPEVVAPIHEVVAPVPAVSTGSPSSTNVDQDAPSPSNSQTTPETQPPIIPNDVEEDNHDIEVAHMGNDPYFGIPILETYKDALTQSFWIEAMQEELNKFKRLGVKLGKGKDYIDGSLYIKFKMSMMAKSQGSFLRTTELTQSPRGIFNNQKQNESRVGENLERNTVLDSWRHLVGYSMVSESGSCSVIDIRKACVYPRFVTFSDLVWEATTAFSHELVLMGVGLGVVSRLHRGVEYYGLQSEDKGLGDDIISTIIGISNGTIGADTNRNLKLSLYGRSESFDATLTLIVIQVSLGKSGFDLL